MKSYRQFREENITGQKELEDISGHEEAGTPFGYLLTIDLYGAKGPLMTNSSKSQKALEKFLLDLVKEIKMDVGGKPVVLMSDKEDIKKYPEHIGASGWICLITSGIQIHTIVPKQFACVDIFSCKKFDPKMADSFLKKSFQTDKLQSVFLKRGVDYNHPGRFRHEVV